MVLRSEPGHILNNTQHRNIDFGIGEHSHTLAGISESHLLRSGHYYDSGHGKSLDQCQMNIACARRHIDEEIVQIAPPCIGYELFQSVARHTSAPQHRLLLVDKKTYGEHPDSIFLDGINPVAPVMALHVEGLILHTEHLRHRRTENIGIKKSDAISPGSKRHGKIYRYRRLAHASLSGADPDYVFHARQEFRFLLGSCLPEFDGDTVLHVDILRDKRDQRGLGRTHHRADERVCRPVKYQRERNFVAVDADIVLHHTEGYDVLPVSGIAHILQCVKY